jgi:hypothetical protein
MTPGLQPNQKYLKYRRYLTPELNYKTGVLGLCPK